MQFLLEDTSGLMTAYFRKLRLGNDAYVLFARGWLDYRCHRQEVWDNAQAHMGTDGFAPPLVKRQRHTLGCRRCGYDWYQRLANDSRSRQVVGGMPPDTDEAIAAAMTVPSNQLVQNNDNSPYVLGVLAHHQHVEAAMRRAGARARYVTCLVCRQTYAMACRPSQVTAARDRAPVPPEPADTPSSGDPAPAPPQPAMSPPSNPQPSLPHSPPPSPQLRQIAESSVISEEKK